MITETRIIAIQKYISPCGEMILGSYQGALCLCDWVVNPRHKAVKQRLQKHLNAEFYEMTSPIIEQTSKQLDEYFSQQRKSFSIPLRIIGTEFQKQVWQQLQLTAYGQTLSYAQLAALINNPKAVRAVANANAANALPIIIPCHRVIGHNKKLIGFAGGLDAKKFLINLETLNK